MKIVWSPLALDRVEEIAHYIARNNRAAAARWLVDIFDFVDRLQQFPESGRMVPEFGLPHVREVIFRRHRVVYRIESQIDILTVRHGRQLLTWTDLTRD